MRKWHGGASDSGGVERDTMFPVIFDGEGNRVCNVDSWPEGNAEGNYERILLCVNAHDALVAALDGALSWLAHIEDPMDMPPGGDMRNWQAALAAAKDCTLIIGREA